MHEGGQPDEGQQNLTGDDEAGSGGRHDGQAARSGTSVVIRRNAGLAALVGGAASAIAIAYLWRATQTGAVFDWALCGVLGVVACYYLVSLLDARTPLLVADELGVRIRLGRQWRGLPWEAVAAVEVQPRRSSVHDGRLVFRPHSLARALEGLEARGRRAARLNQRLYGGALAVPMGLTTSASAEPERLRADLAALSGHRTHVTLTLPAPTPTPNPTPAESARLHGQKAPSRRVRTPKPRRVGASARSAKAAAPAAVEVAAPVAVEVAAPAAPAAVEVAAPAAPAEVEVEADAPATPAEGRPRPRRERRRTLLGGLGAVVSRVPRPGAGASQAASEPETKPSEPTQPLAPAASVAPLRLARRGLRAQVTRDIPATASGSHSAIAALHEDRSDLSGRGLTLPEGRELRRPGSVDLVFEQVGSGSVRPISRLGEPVEPLVLDDFATEPAYDPVIGPQLCAARTRVGLSVDELADRTRIRPHVIEAIEVDDFAPCGGDFYARGHLRTLARVLGQDPVPLLASFDNRYATAPINARRVFEAELATGMNGGMRSTVGGPNWGLMIGVVLCLVMAWGVIRLFEAEPEQLVPRAAPVLNGSAGLDQRPAAGPKQKPTVPLMPVMLIAHEGPTRVVVRDGNEKVVYAGPLVLGERMALRVAPPLTVRAADAGAVKVLVRGRDRGPVGQLDGPGTRTYLSPVSPGSPGPADRPGPP